MDIEPSLPSMPATMQDPMTRIEALALTYLAFPTLVFLGGWIVGPLGPVAAIAVSMALIAFLVRSRGHRLGGTGPLLLPVLLVAALWTYFAGVDHFVYANLDWVVRDAVLVDLVRDRWPVFYRVDDLELVLRAPIGYFLPAALIGKFFGFTAAGRALFVWTASGVALTFAMMLRDKPSLKAAVIRIVVFVVFSGMDIVGSITHFHHPALGDHLEWWAFLFQYSSQTTQLFWVPNHALPGWLAIAWLMGQDPRRLSTTTAILFVVFTPLWSPLTAIGLAPIAGVAIVRRALAGGRDFAARALLDWRMWLPALVCIALVFPFLIAGSDQVASGSNASIRWVGEDIVPRYIEFVVLEFAGFAALLVSRHPRDPLLWTAIVILLLLPTYSFGPANDLAMRASIAPLALLSIQMGRWMSTPRAVHNGPRRFVVALALLAIGAVTPAMEFVRAFREPAWPLDTQKSLVDVTRGTHYLTSPDQPWLRRFLKRADG